MDSVGAPTGSAAAGSGDVDAFEDRDHLGTVTVLPCGDHEGQYPTVGIDGGVGLGPPPATGTTQGVVFRFSGNTIGAVPAGAGGVDVST